MTEKGLKMRVKCGGKRIKVYKRNEKRKKYTERNYEYYAVVIEFKHEYSEWNLFNI